MSEIFFMVEEAPEGGYNARALGESIFTQGEDIESLNRNVREAIRCHFDEGSAPKVIHLRYIKEEVIVL